MQIEHVPGIKFLLFLILISPQECISCETAPKARGGVYLSNSRRETEEIPWQSRADDELNRGIFSGIDENKKEKRRRGQRGEGKNRRSSIRRRLLRTNELNCAGFYRPSASAAGLRLLAFISAPEES